MSLGLACALPGAAHAQTSAADNQRATELFKSGKQAFGRGDMAEAEKLFGEAWAIRRSSDIAANLGQAELEQKKFRSAAEHFAWALANLLPSATEAQRKAVETGLVKARSEIGVLRLGVKPDGAAVLVGEQDLGTAPVARSVYVDPGEAIVSVKRDGYVSIEKRLMVGKGTEQAVDIEISPAGEAALQPASGPVSSGLASNTAAVDSAQPVADRGRNKSLVPAFVATGVAVAGGVTGLVLTLAASSKADDADALQKSLEARSQPPSTAPCSGSQQLADCAKLKDQRESVDSSRNLALGAFIVRAPRRAFAYRRLAEGMGKLVWFPIVKARFYGSARLAELAREERRRSRMAFSPVSRTQE